MKKANLLLDASLNHRYNNLDTQACYTDHLKKCYSPIFVFFFGCTLNSLNFEADMIYEVSCWSWLKQTTCLAFCCIFWIDIKKKRIIALNLNQILKYTHCPDGYIPMMQKFKTEPLLSSTSLLLNPAHCQSCLPRLWPWSSGSNMWYILDAHQEKQRYCLPYGNNSERMWEAAEWVTNQ